MPTARQVLVVEDDEGIRRGIVDALDYAGYEALEAAEGDTGLDLALNGSWEIALLDIVLPGPSGLDILRQVRRTRPTLPVILLTARGEEADRVEGLRLGADDYVVKPFSVKELLARVEAVLRRSPERPQAVTRIPLAEGIADLERREVRFDDGERCELSEREIELLSYLASHARRAISREEILTRVWRLRPNGVETRTIDMHIARLREKLRDDQPKPSIILTVRGKGYMFSGLSAAESAEPAR
jgi:DNA-binding response OmpR family regulator